MREQCLEAHPSVLGSQFAVARGCVYLGINLLARDADDEGFRQVHRAQGLFDRLAEADPAMAGYVENQARCHEVLAMEWVRRHRWDEAVESFDKARSILVELACVHPGQYDADVARAQKGLASARRARASPR